MIKGEQPYFKQDGKDCKHRADKETEAIALPYRYMERPVIVVHHAVTLLGIDAHIPPEQYGERQYQREKRKAVVCFVKATPNKRGGRRIRGASADWFFYVGRLSSYVAAI